MRRWRQSWQQKVEYRESRFMAGAFLLANRYGARVGYYATRHDAEQAKAAREARRTHPMQYDRWWNKPPRMQRCDGTLNCLDHNLRIIQVDNSHWCGDRTCPTCQQRWAKGKMRNAGSGYGSTLRFKHGKWIGSRSYKHGKGHGDSEWYEAALRRRERRQVGGDWQGLSKWERQEAQADEADATYWTWFQNEWEWEADVMCSIADEVWCGACRHPQPGRIADRLQSLRGGWSSSGSCHAAFSA